MTRGTGRSGRLLVLLGLGDARDGGLARPGVAAIARDACVGERELSGLGESDEPITAETDVGGRLMIRTRCVQNLTLFGWTERVSPNPPRPSP